MLLKDIDFTTPNVDEVITPALTNLDAVLTATTAENFSPDAVISPVTESREVLDKQIRDLFTAYERNLIAAKSYIDSQNDTIRSLTDKIVVRGDVQPTEMDRSDVDKLIAGEVL